MDKKFHFVYKTIRDDGHYYLGMHSTNILDDSYLGSGRLIRRSIRKHGPEKHSRQILIFAKTRKELEDLERAFISESTLKDPLCMNLAPGGQGGAIRKGPHSAETKKKISLAAKSRSPEKKLELSKKLSDIAKKRHPSKVANFIKAAKNKSAETRSRLSEARKGKSLSDETKAKLAAASSKIRWTDEQRVKHSALQKARAAAGGFVPKVSGKKIVGPDGQVFESKSEAKRVCGFSKRKFEKLLLNLNSGWSILC